MKGENRGEKKIRIRKYTDRKKETNTEQKEERETYFAHKFTNRKQYSDMFKLLRTPQTQAQY
jgi:hypothetical protein